MIFEYCTGGAESERRELPGMPNICARSTSVDFSLSERGCLRAVEAVELADMPPGEALRVVLLCSSAASSKFGLPPPGEAPRLGTVRRAATPPAALAGDGGRGEPGLPFRAASLPKVRLEILSSKVMRSHSRVSISSTASKASPLRLVFSKSCMMTSFILFILSKESKAGTSAATAVCAAAVARFSISLSPRRGVQIAAAAVAEELLVRCDVLAPFGSSLRCLRVSEPLELALGFLDDVFPELMSKESPARPVALRPDTRLDAVVVVDAVTAVAADGPLSSVCEAKEEPWHSGWGPWSPPTGEICGMPAMPPSNCGRGCVGPIGETSIAEETGANGEGGTTRGANGAGSKTRGPGSCIESCGMGPSVTTGPASVAIMSSFDFQSEGGVAAPSLVGPKSNGEEGTASGAPMV